MGGSKTVGRRAPEAAWQGFCRRGLFWSISRSDDVDTVLIDRICHSSMCFDERARVGGETKDAQLVSPPFDPGRGESSELTRLVDDDLMS